LFLILKLSLF